MNGTAISGRSPNHARQRFLDQLLEIWRDPKVKRLALRRAGTPELARDALNQAYDAVARRGPEGIKDLKAYYCRALINAVNDLRYQFTPILTQDFEKVAESRQDNLGGQPRPVDEAAGCRLLAEAWVKCFVTRRAELTARVPGRSPDPERYRAVIAAAAGRVLCANITGDVSDADFPSALTAAYPDWFAEPQCAENTRHQRFCRARADVRELLRAIVSRDDLYH